MRRRGGRRGRASWLDQRDDVTARHRADVAHFAFHLICGDCEERLVLLGKCRVRAALRARPAQDAEGVEHTFSQPCGLVRFVHRRSPTATAIFGRSLIDVPSLPLALLPPPLDLALRLRAINLAAKQVAAWAD